MPIQLIDNFDLQSPKPIDNRFVVGGDYYYQNREQITFKYPGMRIWDLNDNAPYVWTGSTFSSENTLGSVNAFGSPSPGSIAKFGVSNTIGPSLMFDNGNNIGIGTSSPAYRLDVVGTIRATLGFYGNGANITGINATNITSGNLSLSNLELSSGATGRILTHAGTTAQWTGTSSISVGNTDISRLITVSNNNSSTIYNFVFCPPGTADNKQLYFNSNALVIQPSTGFIGVGISNNPTTNLDINGQIRIRGGNPGAGKLLTSDANGLASWTADIGAPVGTIIMWGGAASAIPTNYKLCDGTPAPNPSALYTKLTTSGTSWYQLFGTLGKVPDLRERFIVGAGGPNPSVSNTAYPVAAVGGSNQVTLTSAQIPAHTHTFTTNPGGAHSHDISVDLTDRSGGNAGLNQPGGNDGYVATTHAPAHNHSGTTQINTGGDGAHENRPPYFALCFLIKVN